MHCLSGDLRFPANKLKIVRVIEFSNADWDRTKVNTYSQYRIFDRGSNQPRLLFN